MPEVVYINDTLADRIVTHQVAMLRTASGSLSATAKLLSAADNETFQLLASQSNDDGMLSSAKIDRILNRVQSINTKAYQTIGKLLRKDLTDFAHYEIDFNRDLLDTHLPFRYATKKPARAFVAAIADEEPMQGGLLLEWVEGLSQGRYNRTRAQIRLGVSNRESVNQIVTNIRGKKSLGYRDGVAALSRRSLGQLVNTIYNHVANRARLDFYKANGSITYGYQWSAVLDDRTCEECGSLDGETFAIDDYEYIPPLHINCRCVLIPIISPIDPDDYDFPRPKKLRYEAWLNNQTAAFQDEILGPARAAMFRRGMKLSKFTDNSGIRYNLSELRNMEAKSMAPKSKPPSRDNSKALTNFGWRADIPDIRDHQFSLAHPQKVQLAPKISLRNRFTFPVFDQGSIGSCVANACVAQHMFVHKSDVLLSRLDLYWLARFLEGTTDEDSGVMIRDGVKALQKFGVCTEQSWPYKVRKFAVDPPPDADKEALQYRITSYSRLSSLTDYQNCLMSGYPFVFGFSVYSNIYSTAAERHGILSMPIKQMQLLGGHAVIAIGYDTDFHNNPAFKRSGLTKDSVPSFMFEVRNSWGPKWGDGGHFWIPADYVNNRDLSDDFWTIRS